LAAGRSWHLGNSYLSTQQTGATAMKIAPTLLIGFHSLLIAFSVSNIMQYVHPGIYLSLTILNLCGIALNVFNLTH
jgi:hypothetical protein